MPEEEPTTAAHTEATQADASPASHAADDGPPPGPVTEPVHGHPENTDDASNPGTPASPEPADAPIPTGVRRIERTVHRRTTIEDVDETVVEDVPLTWAPPASAYPKPVG